MTRLVGQHLALLLLERSRALDQGMPPDPERTELVEAAFEAALAQERQLAVRTSSAQVGGSQAPGAQANVASRAELPRSVQGHASIRCVRLLVGKKKVEKKFRGCFLCAVLC